MAVPLVVVHGASDETVSCEDGVALAKASGVEPVLIEGGNHVFNVANPFDPEDEPSSQLAALENVLLDVLRTF